MQIFAQHSPEKKLLRLKQKHHQGKLFTALGTVFFFFLNKSFPFLFFTLKERFLVN